MHKFISIVSALLMATSVHASTLIIGDSHIVGPVGDKLHQLFRDSGEDVRTIGLGGATANTYTSPNPKERTLNYGFADRKNDTIDRERRNTPRTVPELKTLLAEQKPQRLVIELGDNFATYRNPSPAADKAAIAQVKKITGQLRDSGFHGRCYWITPTWTDKAGQKPYYKSNDRLKEIIQIIKDHASPCQVIDSTEAIAQKDINTIADGLHFDTKNGSKWAQAAHAKILSLERRPVSGGQKSSGAR